jgi:threonine dehydrogenase-like Zn-dependent dehydrogenase
MQKELWFTAPGEVEIRSVESFDVKGLINVKSHYSLISTGTEMLMYNGNVPEELHETMKVPYIKGDFNFPFTYGYSLVGQINDKYHVDNGRFVHLLHPHQSYANVSSEFISLIPEAIDPKLAVLTSNLETALNAVWDGNIKIGENVLIVGFGIIGALLAGVLKSIKHVNIYIAETNKERIQLVKQLGLKLYTDEVNLDAAFNTSANEKGFQIGLNSIGFEGRLIELSWYGKKEIKVSLGGDFHSKRKKIISSQVGSLPTDMRSLWDYKRRKDVVFELLKDDYFGELPLEEINFDNAPEAYRDLNNNKINGLAKIIKYV